MRIIYRHDQATLCKIYSNAHLYPLELFAFCAFHPFQIMFLGIQRLVWCYVFLMLLQVSVCLLSCSLGVFISDQLIPQCPVLCVKTEVTIHIKPNLARNAIKSRAGSDLKIRASWRHHIISQIRSRCSSMTCLCSGRRLAFPPRAEGTDKIRFRCPATRRV